MMTPRDRLYNAVLTLNILNAHETVARAAERHWTIEKTAGLSQPVYCKDALTSVWEMGKVLQWGRGYAYVSIGVETLWIPSKLIKLRHEQERSPRCLDCCYG